MNLTAETLGFSTLVTGWLILIVALLLALKTAPWFKVKNDRAAQNVWLGMSLIVFLIWQFSAQIADGISFHFLLVTLMTLMFGWQFALLGATLALVGLAFYVPTGWQAIGVNAGFMVLLPIWLTVLFVKLCDKYLEPNFFVYVFFNGFLAAGVSSVLVLSVGGLVMLANDVHSLEILSQVFFPFIPLMAIPEGFVNGMLIAVLIALKPQWVASFQDSKHLR